MGQDRSMKRRPRRIVRKSFARSAPSVGMDESKATGQEELLDTEIRAALEQYAKNNGVSFADSLQRAVWELLYREEYRQERYDVETDFSRSVGDFEPLWKNQEARTEGIHYQSITLRTSKEQKHLVDFAARRSRLSIQKLVAHIVFSEIEEVFGAGFDEYRKSM